MIRLLILWWWWWWWWWWGWWWWQWWWWWHGWTNSSSWKECDDDVPVLGLFLMFWKIWYRTKSRNKSWKKLSIIAWVGSGLDILSLAQDFFSLCRILSLLGRSPKWKVQLIKSQLSKTLEWANKNLQCVGDFWESRYVRSISILCRCTSTFSNAWME